MALAPSQTMKGADTMTVSLTPTISQWESETWSALRATFTVIAAPLVCKSVTSAVS